MYEEKLLGRSNVVYIGEIKIILHMKLKKIGFVKIWLVLQNLLVSWHK
jgi:hypothetical protein